MDFIAFSVEGYRRFVKKTSVKLHGSLIAFVGPNEAGKSSLLRAMAHLNHDHPLEADETPRRTNDEPVLSWQFQLDADDKQAISDIPDADGLERVVITKYADGSRNWEFVPHAPRRDISERSSPALSFVALSADPYFESDDEVLGLSDLIQTVGEVLTSKIDSLPQSQLDSIGSLHDALLSAQNISREEDSYDSDGKPRAAYEDYLVKLSACRTELARLLERESKPSPRKRARAALEPRVPHVHFFRREDRELDSSYELQTHADDPPGALEHLALLAGIDLTRVRDDAMAGKTADVTTAKNRANRVLREVFAESWNQQDIAIQLEFQGSVLHIQATTPEDEGVSTIGERSDGMRWFAALLAYAHNWSGKPILLADEIETHLHYDAQADLVNVLSKQEFTSKVIYTTHSIGCLPHDLGNGVRAVEQIDGLTSKLRNDFWNDGAGFAPLLAVMGASAVSFTPSRKAVVGEGAGEAILLPTLLREAAGRAKLDFQVVPGLASVAATAIPDLNTQAGQLAFVVDGDEGGLGNRDKLLNAGVAQARIAVLQDQKTKDQLELEDFIAADIYAAAVNQELRCWNTVETDMPIDALSQSLVTKSVRSWCAERDLRPPDKGAVAQRVVDMSHDREVQTVVNSKRRPTLVRLLADLEEILQTN